MRSSRNSVPLGTLAAIGIAFLLLAGTGESNFKVDGIVALVVGALVLTYLIWSNIHTRSAKPHLLLPDEVKVDETMRHPIIRIGAVVIAAISCALVLYSISLHSSGGSTVRSAFPGLGSLFGPPRPRRHHGHHGQAAQQNIHLSVDLWWWPLLLAIPLLIVALHVWQNWKYTSLVITNKRFIERREVSPYVPWLTPYFNQTPFEQIVDSDDDTDHIGNIGNWWGTLKVTRQKSEITDKTEPIDKYHLLPRYIEFADTLRGARADFRSEAEGRRMAAEEARRAQEERLATEQIRHHARIADALERLSPPPPAPVIASQEETQDLPDLPDDTGEIPTV
jgi:hypothetical protein